jgi:hypothetical protein
MVSIKARIAVGFSFLVGTFQPQVGISPFFSSTSALPGPARGYKICLEILTILINHHAESLSRQQFRIVPAIPRRRMGLNHSEVVHAAQWRFRRRLSYPWLGAFSRRATSCFTTCVEFIKTAAKGVELGLGWLFGHGGW